MALDGYGANYLSAPQGWNENAKRDIDINKDGRPNNEEGQKRMQNIFSGLNANYDMFNNFVSKSKDNFINDEGENTGLQNNALMGSMIGSEFASNLANRDSDKAAARSMDVGEFFNNMNANDKSRDRYEQSMYGKDFMAFSADVQNRFANQDFGRGLRALDATSVQGRKDIYAQSDANNMGRVVQGEQDRQLVLAESDRDVRGYQAKGLQDRLGYRTLGDETRMTDTNRIGQQGLQDRLGDTNRINTQGVNDRLGYRTLGDETRMTDTNRIGQQGFQDRLGYETLGKEQRATDSNRISTQGIEDRATDSNRIGAQGTEDRKGYRTLGKQTRKTLQAQGIEDRSLEMVRSDRDVRKAGAEGFQERLNEETRGKESRRTIDFSDRIGARKEGRQSKRASNLARSF